MASVKMRPRGLNQCFSADMIIQFTYTHTHFYVYTDPCRLEACGFLYLQKYIYIHIFFIYKYIPVLCTCVVARQCRYIQDVLDRSTCNAYVYIYTHIHTHLCMHMFVDMYIDIYLYIHIVHICNPYRYEYMNFPHPPLPPVSGLRGSGFVVQKLYRYVGFT